MAMRWGRRYWQVLAGTFLVACGVAAALPTRPISSPPRWATMGAPLVPASLGHTPRSEYKSNAPAGKRSKKLPYPPRRCAALIDARSQCPASAIEPTDYCARHQKSGPRPKH